MKDYAKVGNRKGRPAYRTPASFRLRRYLKGQAIRRRGKGGAKGENKP